MSAPSCASAVKFATAPATAEMKICGSESFVWTEILVKDASSDTFTSGNRMTNFSTRTSCTVAIKMVYEPAALSRSKVLIIACASPDLFLL